MSRVSLNRRSFLGGSAASLISLAGIAKGHAGLRQRKPRHRVERLAVGAIGMRYQGSVITEKARELGDIVAISDVDRHVREQARASFGSTPAIYEDYRDMLQRKDLDVILIAAPDHWHTKMLIDSCRAGKDVYCEKPLTLTIDEGKVIRNVVNQTQRVVQVGTWQRSDARFRLAAELVRSGKIGKLQRVTCTTDKNPTGGSFQTQTIPSHFNWDLWQGQTPDVPYIPERSHYTFRWWYEYSGGKMTDWGAHHIDIAQWAIGAMPKKVSGTGKHPSIENGYNVASDFSVDIEYENGVQLLIRDEGRRGILFEGDQGRLFVNRGTIAGQVIDQLKDNPVEKSDYKLYGFDNWERPDRVGKLDAIVNHMANFFECIESRNATISDVESQHRSVSTCHIANISLRLGRDLTWDASKEEFVDDKEANTYLSRPQRSGFETV